jgi:hypothetical protein
MICEKALAMDARSRFNRAEMYRIYRLAFRIKNAPVLLGDAVLHCMNNKASSLNPSPENLATLS